MSEEDDILAALGVTLPERRVRGERRGATVECGQSPPKEKPRFTGWSNIHTFEAGGYVARVTRYTCLCCEDMVDVLEGVFILELHKPSGTRRLTRMAKGCQFPIGKGHAKEVTEAEVEICGSCVGSLGFDREVDARGLPYTLEQGKGKVK